MKSTTDEPDEKKKKKNYRRPKKAIYLFPLSRHNRTANSPLGDVAVLFWNKYLDLEKELFNSQSTT